MPSVKYEGESYQLEPGESVLECLLRNRIAISSMCRAGACQSCLMRTDSPHLPAKSQQGLKETLKARGYFLACVCRPETDLEVYDGASELRVGASIQAIDSLGARVLRVRLQCDNALDYKAGQYITLLREDGLARSYSLASLPNEELLELHVRLIPNGKMSSWLEREARIGDRVTVQGPAGNCFYTPGRPEQPLLLVGTGTGLAPLYGIARDALLHGHTGSIHFLHGALNPAGLYLVDELQRMVSEHPNFCYTPNVMEGRAEDGYEIGSIDRIVQIKYPKTKGLRAYLCGDPQIVQTLKKQLFLGGAAFNDILADAFLPSSV